MLNFSGNGLSLFKSISSVSRLHGQRTRTFQNIRSLLQQGIHRFQDFRTRLGIRQKLLAPRKVRVITHLISRADRIVTRFADFLTGSQLLLPRGHGRINVA
ncbi:hypothetical protein D1872_266500 [compost metagenome]